MKNCMNVPEEREPVLLGKTEDSLLTQTAIAVGKVIAMLQHSPNTNIFRLEINQFNNQFNVKDLTPDQFQELKFACANHLSELIPELAKENIDD